MAAETDNSTDIFELAGRKYEVPDFVDLDLDDWEIVYDECGCVLADFQPEDPESKNYDPEREEKRRERVRNPRLERAFIMVALRRARPDDDLDMLRKEAGRIKLIPYLNEVAGEVADPPTSATKPEPPSRESSGSTSGNSSPDSDKNLEIPEAELETTGTGE